MRTSLVLVSRARGEALGSGPSLGAGTRAARCVVDSRDETSTPTAAVTPQIASTASSPIVFPASKVLHLRNHEPCVRLVDHDCIDQTSDRRGAR
ncbi:MAG TPA: hypothetical protein VMJ10_29310 [Kofleriaceae bacterium]|nr:hypothetical protein [Kofleriaceae bacterium]